MSEINYKIILIGNSGVGKTSFFRKIATGEFYDKNISTIGIEKKSLELNIDIQKDGKKEKKKFNISLFDTAGQEKFRSVTLNYYKGSDGIFLIYDITDKTSFDHVRTWIESINDSLGRNKDQKYAMILIGNKLDLVEENPEDRKVEEEDAQKICKEFGMRWGGEQSIKSISFEELKKIYGEYVEEIYHVVGENSCASQKLKKGDKFKKKKLGCLGRIVKPD